METPILLDFQNELFLKYFFYLKNCESVLYLYCTLRELTNHWEKTIRCFYHVT